jgi:hypothetical protein
LTFGASLECKIEASSTQKKSSPREAEWSGNKQDEVSPSQIDICAPLRVDHGYGGVCRLSPLEATHAQWRYHAGIEQQNIIEEKSRASITTLFFC